MRWLDVTFQNDSSHEVTLYWWSYDGEKVPYATVAPGGQSTQTTSPTHPWTAEATDGSSVAIAGGEVYTVTDAQNQVVSISDAEAAPSQPGHRSGPWTEWVGFWLLNQTDETVSVHFWDQDGVSSLEGTVGAGQWHHIWASPSYVYTLEAASPRFVGVDDSNVITVESSDHPRALYITRGQVAPVPVVSDVTITGPQGTIFTNGNWFSDNDLTVYQGVQRLRCRQDVCNKADMYDRQHGFITQGDAYVFDLNLSDQSGIRIAVNKLYPWTAAEAHSLAVEYGQVVGRLPYVLRRDLERLTINGGDFAWGGGAP